MALVQAASSPPFFVSPQFGHPGFLMFSIPPHTPFPSPQRVSFVLSRQSSLAMTTKKLGRNLAKDAVSVCLPVTKAAIRDAEKGTFLESSSLHITFSTSPTENKDHQIINWNLGDLFLQYSAK
ncbi:hypothetical protein L1987_43307 [Smallanthus sonchifolius]|uniref:Uncharacterized protein n=1 Tax=Smallanthus sonchifolius TaxID=185202 RepID=A0ACB9GNB4_9ASTR|nr:hypothetical protein L1987_43307 [Smallanthus sonchifolius]